MSEQTAAGASATARSSATKGTGKSVNPRTAGRSGTTGTNVNGAPLLGDSRDAFRPATSSIPTSPGVYKWRDKDGRVIYVGKAKNLRNRLTFYFQPLSMLHPRTQEMVLTARSLEWTVVGTELEALTLEYTWIKEFDPHFNVVFRDDKTYPYLAVSFGEEIPRIWITRSQKTRKTKYFGPYVKVYDLRQSLDRLLTAYPVRTCTPGVLHRAQRTGRPCLLASIGKCSAPCVGAISLEDHRERITELTGILTGRLGAKYVRNLTARMKKASDDLDFEMAARLRDQIKAMSSVLQSNAVVFADDVDADVFGLAGDELEASVHAFFVRAGTIRGERNWSVEKVEDIDDAQLMSDLIVQAYSQVLEENRKESDADGFRPTYRASTSIERKRDAVAASQSMTALTARERGKASREHKIREAETGRVDLFSQSSPIPSEILVPVLPADCKRLETWLSAERGSAVTIHVPQRGDKHQLLERAEENAKLGLARHKAQRSTSLAARTEAMNDVKRQLGLPNAPLHIEGYDISNAAGGGYQVASMVVFEDGMAKRSEYRRFAIKGATREESLDDLSALRETITRRFKHGNVAGDSGESIESQQAEESEKTTKATEKALPSASRHFAYKPNLIVVDGGRAQANAVKSAMESMGVTDVAVCGLAKRLEEVWLPGEDYPLILKRQSEGLYLLQRVRDESHRFAITYHRMKRRKGEVSSLLDSIPGVGDASAKRLLAHFGSFKKLRAATADEIAEVKGFGTARAQQVYSALHADDAAEQSAKLSAGESAPAAATAPNSGERIEKAGTRI